jgi:hypothetical protein
MIAASARDVNGIASNCDASDVRIPTRPSREAFMKRWMWWASWFPSALGIFIILTSARWKLTRSPFYVAEWTRIGYSDSALLGIGILQVTCLVLYLIPRTAVLGMVLLTGYLGGAIASYVRMR